MPILKKELETISTISGNSKNILDVNSKALLAFELEETDYINKIVNFFATKDKTKLGTFVLNNIKQIPIHYINLKEYPLAVTLSKDNVIFANMSTFLAKDVIAVSNKDMFTITLYALMFYKCVNNLNKFSGLEDLVSQYFYSVLFRFYRKKAGLMGDTIKQQKLFYLVSVYVYVSLFGYDLNERTLNKLAISRIVDLSKYKLDYNFKTISGFVDSIKGNSIIPLSLATFSQEVMKYGKIQSLPMFEDVSRFISILASSNIIGNSLISSVWINMRSDLTKLIMTKILNTIGR